MVEERTTRKKNWRAVMKLLDRVRSAGQIQALNITLQVVLGSVKVLHRRRSRSSRHHSIVRMPIRVGASAALVLGCKCRYQPYLYEALRHRLVADVWKRNPCTRPGKPKGNSRRRRVQVLFPVKERRSNFNSYAVIPCAYRISYCNQTTVHAALVVTCGEHSIAS